MNFDDNKTPLILLKDIQDEEFSWNLMNCMLLTTTVNYHNTNISFIKDYLHKTTRIPH